MSSAYYISSSCVISDRVIYRNGLPVFAGEESQLPELLISAYRHFGYQYLKFFKMDNLGKLGWLAAEILLSEGFDKNRYRPEEVGLVLSNAHASLDTDTRYYETVKDIPSPALFVYTLPNIVIGEISIRHGFKGENAFFVSESFDAGFIEHYVTRLVNNDILQACICGWVDVLGDRYKAALFLVEKEKRENSVTFTAKNLNNLYALQNG